jgi:hypothetical protein
MTKVDPVKLKKDRLLLLQSLVELQKNATELYKTVSKKAQFDNIDFNYFISKYLKYIKTGQRLYGKKFDQFKLTVSDSEYKKITGLKKVITEMGLVIIFIKNDVGNVIEENIKLKKLLKKYKSQAMSIQKIT